jgi:hypothetical protein
VSHSACAHASAVSTTGGVGGVVWCCWWGLLLLLVLWGVCVLMVLVFVGGRNWVRVRVTDRAVN